MTESERDPNSPVEQINALGAKWSPDLDRYATGEADASKRSTGFSRRLSIRCALCANAPCACPEFGTDEYFALVNRRHGKKGSK